MSKCTYDNTQPWFGQWGYCSGMHRLLEGQGQKEGHFSTRFGSQEGTLVHVLASKSAVYHVLTSQGGSLVCFANQEGTLARIFGSQEGNLAHVFTPGGHFNRRFSTIGPQGGMTAPPPLVHITGLLIFLHTAVGLFTV